MALELQYAISELPNATGIVFYDTTGDFDAVTNPGGWGSGGVYQLAFDAPFVAGSTLHLTLTGSGGLSATKTYNFTTNNDIGVLIISEDFASYSTNVTYAQVVSGGTGPNSYFNAINIKIAAGQTFVISAISVTGSTPYPNVTTSTLDTNPPFLNTNYAELSLYDNNGIPIGTVDTEFPFSDFDVDRKMVILATSYGLPTFADMVLQITYTARDSNGGTVLATLTNKVLLDSVCQTNLKNAELKIPSCEGNIISTVTNKLQVYRGLLISYGQMVPQGIYTEAQLGIDQLVLDTNNLCIMVGS